MSKCEDSTSASGEGSDCTSQDKKRNGCRHVFILSVRWFGSKQIWTTLIGWHSTSSPGERARERDNFKSIVDRKIIHLIAFISRCRQTGLYM